jgi:hypothetical protein
MNKTFRRLAAFGIGTALQGSLIGLALAQGSPVPSRAADLLAQYEAPEAKSPGESSEDTSATELPVLYITSVEVLRTAVDPKLDIVRVTGLVASQGWTDPELVPTYEGKPLNDTLDLEFIATTPEESQSAGGFVRIDAIFPFEDNSQIKGVRVRASENAIEVKEIPGRNQTTIDVNDCKECVGKKFVAEGQAQAGQQGVVRQEDLPKGLRLIMPSSGIRGAEQDPNRLTLILGDDHTILNAFWE